MRRTDKKFTKLRARFLQYAGILFLLTFFSAIEIRFLINEGSFQRLGEPLIEQERFRSQQIGQELSTYLKTAEDPGLHVALYWMASDFGAGEFPGGFTVESFQKQDQIWSGRKGWDSFLASCRSIWNDAVYFPVPEPSNDAAAGISYVDSWMYDRSYGGDRKHEGTDLMALEDQRGYYPVVSMTDGIVRHKGWLEQGGWRIGITAPGGAYFYYAHLDSYAQLEEGDSVKAGDLLGFMGDTGYGKEEGTKGNFPVHLHLGIYLNEGEDEVSVNPYWILRTLEDRKIKCVYSR